MQKRELKKLISEDRIKEVIRFLEEKLYHRLHEKYTDFANNFYNAVILNGARLNNINKSSNIGIFEKEYTDTELSKIRHSILKIIDELPANYLDNSEIERFEIYKENYLQKAENTDNTKEKILFYNKAFEQANKDFAILYKIGVNCHQIVQRTFDTIKFLSEISSHDTINNCRIYEEFSKVNSCLDLAEKSLKKYIALNKTYPNVYLILSQICIIKQKYSEAINYLEKSISLKKDFYQAYFELGNIFKLSVDYEKALFYFNKSIEINMDYAEAYFEIGQVYKFTNDYVKAKAFYEKAIELKANFYKAETIFTMLDAYMSASEGVKSEWF